jgi:hypothetical protein
MYVAAGRIIRSILTDTLDSDPEELRSWMRNTGSLEAWYRLADTYVFENDSLRTFEVLDSISMLFTFDSAGQIEYDFFRELKEIQLELIKAGGNILNLDSAIVQQFRFIADNSTGLAGSQAQTLLNFGYGYNYQLSPQQPNGGGERSSGTVSSQSIPRHGAAFIEVYPNPTSSGFTVRYRLPEDKNEAVFIVTDSWGRFLFRQELRNNEDAFTWVPDVSTQGILSFKLYSSAGFFHSGKLVIIK